MTTPSTPTQSTLTPAAGTSAAPSQPAASSTPSGSSSPAAEPALDHVAAGLLIVGFRGLSLPQDAWIRTAIDAGLGGVILFDRDQNTGRERNVHSPSQVSALVRELHEAAGRRPFIVAIDQEGGVVTRLSPTHGFPAVASEATVGGGTAAAARIWARDLVATLAAAGVDLNFAPVVDLDVNPRSAAIGALHRSFSADPDVVVRMATIEIDAHRKAGVRTAIKHFPGIGSAATNTDLGIADVTGTWSRTELEPFSRLIRAGEADLVMVGHVINGQLDRGMPASLSPRVVAGLLRTDLGFRGPIVTDDLQAGAITKAFGADDAIVLALQAGHDLLLFANQQVYAPTVVAHAVEVILAAVAAGRVTEERLRASWRRVQGAFTRARA